MSEAHIHARDLSVEFPVSAGIAAAGSGGDAPEAAGRIVRQGRGAVLRALDRVELSIQAGERVGVLGKNGSGKTTLLRALRGVYPPSRGVLEVRGTVQSFFNISFGMNEDATGYENILIRGVLMGASPRQMKALTPDIAAFSELGEFLKAPVRQYSTGMRMRLAFSVATALPADILLMDEWLSVGDIDFREKVAERLNDVVKASKILVIASHNKRILEATCNRMITLSEGRIVEDRKVTEVYEKVPFYNPDADMD